MEKHDDIFRTLQTVLPTQLLAPSMSALASALGYSGRNSFYRIIKGEAGPDSISNLLKRLEANLNTDFTALQRMEAAINNASEFRRLIRPEFRQDYPEWQYQAILAFIVGEYDYFSPEFQNGDLQTILRFRRSDPGAFYNMLAWFYIKELEPRFYDRRKTHSERCAAILEPLGDRLCDIFPGNGLGLTAAYAYSLSEIYNAEPQTLWSLVESMAVTLEAFSSPVGTADKDGRYRLIPGFTSRTFWQGKDIDKVLLLWLRPGREPATGHYELFSIDRPTGKTECLASIFILSEEIASVFTKHDSNTRMTVYDHSHDTLSFQWEDPEGDPMQTGNRWTRLSTATSQTLRELDRKLTDDTLIREMVMAEGFDYDFALQPADIILSRRKLTLIFKDDSSLSFPIDSAPFLKNLTPGEPMMVCRQLTDGRLFAIWPEIRQSIPLDMMESSYNSKLTTLQLF